MTRWRPFARGPLAGMWAILALALALALTAGAARADLQATIEPRIVDEFDTVRLTIRATDTAQTAALDLDPLRRDFEVLTTQSSSQYRSVNGRVESWVEYQIMLRPRRSGDITIPPIQVGAEASRELRLRVRGIDPALRETIDRMVFFETELTTNPVYVQAQTVLVRRLYYSSGAQIYSDLPGMPDVPDAIVMPLGEATSTATIRDGQRYGVIEQRFAILPERSGEVTIPAISVTSSVRLQSDGRTRRSGVRVATEPLTLEVLPIPSEYPADHPWLPAEDLSLSASWTPDQRTLAVGDPVRLTLRAAIRGNVSSAVPPLEPALPDAHFRRYPEPPDLQDDDSGPSVRGLREQAYAIIPTAPGTVALPAVEVVWWDVATRQTKIARVAGRNLSITGQATQLSPPPERTDVSTTSPTEAPAAAPTPAAPASDPIVEPDAARRTAAMIVVLSAVLAGLLVWLLRDHLFRTAAAAPKDAERAARRALKEACRSRDGGAIHGALLVYLRRHFDAPLPEALRRFREAGYADLLARLNASRYQADPGGGADPGGSVNPEEILAAVRSLRRPRRRAAPSLPALYD
ncbi:MAG: BatD family protein [Pseudomonadales bacterium]